MNRDVAVPQPSTAPLDGVAILCCTTAPPRLLVDWLPGTAGTKCRRRRRLCRIPTDFLAVASALMSPAWAIRGSTAAPPVHELFGGSGAAAAAAALNADSLES